MSALRRRPGYRILKRAMDVALASLGLVTTAPLLLLAALALRLESRGPVLFGHVRVGRAGRTFRAWKLRTMAAGRAPGGAELTIAGDRRVTRVGRILRASKLDELPQLWNVLRGEMSLVGPRPEVAPYVALFPTDYEELLAVRPGITDPASIAYRDEEGLLAASADPEREYLERILPEKLRLSREYLASASLAADMRVLARTLWCILVR